MTLLTRSLSLPAFYTDSQKPFTDLCDNDRKILQNVTKKFLQHPHRVCPFIHLPINKNRIDLSPIHYSHHRSPAIKQDMGPLFARCCNSYDLVLKDVISPILTTRANAVDNEIMEVIENQPNAAQKKFLVTVQKMEETSSSEPTDTSCGEISESDLEDEIRDILITGEEREQKEAEKRQKLIPPNAIAVTPFKPQKTLNFDALHPSRERSYSWDKDELMKLQHPSYQSAFTLHKKIKSLPNSDHK